MAEDDRRIPPPRPGTSVLPPVVPQRVDLDEDGRPKPPQDGIREKQARGIHTDD